MVAIDPRTIPVTSSGANLMLGAYLFPSRLTSFPTIVRRRPAHGPGQAQETPSAAIRKWSWLLRESMLW